MDCDFCNITQAIHLSVPTVLGRVAHLCDDCLQLYARRPVCIDRQERKKGGPPKTAQTQNPQWRESCLLVL